MCVFVFHPSLRIRRPAGDKNACMHAMHLWMRRGEVGAARIAIQHLSVRTHGVPINTQSINKIMLREFKAASLCI